MNKQTAEINELLGAIPRCDTRYCGRGCTEAEYQEAVHKCDRLVKHLGVDSFHAEVWENLGWHYSAVSNCERLKVYSNGEHSYTAYIGRWAEHGSTPKKAIEATFRVAEFERAAIVDLLSGLVYRTT